MNDIFGSIVEAVKIRIYGYKFVYLKCKKTRQLYVYFNTLDEIKSYIVKVKISIYILN